MFRINHLPTYYVLIMKENPISDVLIIDHPLHKAMDDKEGGGKIWTKN